jgi:hypothetical protein
VDGGTAVAAAGAGNMIEHAFDSSRPDGRRKAPQKAPRKAPESRARETPNRCNKTGVAAVTVAMSTLATRTRSLLPTLLLMLLAGVLVLVVLPAVLSAAGGTAT